MATMEQINALAAPTPESERKERPAPGGSGKMLTYVDARWVQDRLDEAVGPTDWQRVHSYDSDGNVTCGIGIRVDRDDVDEWVWKWDVGTESTIEEVKGAYSDAFKRAAVQWGIARDLYDERMVAPSMAPPRYAHTHTVASTVAASGWLCPVHGVSKTVKAGISKRTGKPYNAFEVCGVSGCDEKPPRTVRPARRNNTPVPADLDEQYVGMLGEDEQP